MAASTFRSRLSVLAIADHREAPEDAAPRRRSSEHRHQKFKEEHKNTREGENKQVDEHCVLSFLVILLGWNDLLLKRSSWQSGQSKISQSRLDNSLCLFASS